MPTITLCAILALYAIAALLLAIAFVLGWRHYDRHRILCLQATGPTSLIEYPAVRVHPDTQRTCERLGVAVLIFLAIALIATYVYFFQQCQPYTVPFLLIGIIVILSIADLPVHFHALGARARWHRYHHGNPISEEELFARVWACDIVPKLASHQDFYYPQASQPYRLAEQCALRDRIAKIRADREEQLTFNRQKFISLHSGNSRDLAAASPEEFANRYDEAVEAELALRQAISKDETFVTRQDRMLNGLDSRLRAAKRFSGQLTFRK